MYCDSPYWVLKGSRLFDGEVQDQLKGVQQIQSTDFAFAALLADGTVAFSRAADVLLFFFFSNSERRGFPWKVTYFNQEELVPHFMFGKQHENKTVFHVWCPMFLVRPAKQGVLLFFSFSPGHNC